MRKASEVVNRTVMMNGGSTGPTVELYQRASGTCRLWWYASDQDSESSGTLANFHELDWKQAQKTASKILAETLANIRTQGLQHIARC